LQDPRDPLVNDEIMLIGDTLAVGDGGGRGNIPINEGSLNIPTPTLKKVCVVSLTKGTFDPTLDPRSRVQNAR
jgi:hypothetical protein